MWTIETFRPVYQEYLESGKTVRQFCKDYPLHESRFFHWQHVLRQEAASGQSGEFMPVSINNHNGKVVMVGGNPVHGVNPPRLQQPACEISFPNGVTVKLNVGISPDLLRSLALLPR